MLLSGAYILTFSGGFTTLHFEERAKMPSPSPFKLLVKAYFDTLLKVKNMKRFTKEQRYQIKAYLKCGKSVSFIAIALNVRKTTIYRELKREARKRGSYDPAYAHQLANERKKRFAFQ